MFVIVTQDGHESPRHSPRASVPRESRKNSCGLPASSSQGKPTEPTQRPNDPTPYPIPKIVALAGKTWKNKREQDVGTTDRS